MERIMEEEGGVEVGRKLSCICCTSMLSEFVIIDQGTGFLHRSTVYGAEPTIPHNEKEVGVSLRSAGSERCKS